MVDFFLKVEREIIKKVDEKKGKGIGFYGIYCERIYSRRRSKM